MSGSRSGLCAALASLALSACGQTPMGNDAIIQETKKCEAAGMDAVRLVNGLSSRTVVIECWPRKQPSETKAGES